MPLPSLPTIMFEPLVRATLLEDLGRAGDLTTDAIVPQEATATLTFAVRQPGVIAGMGVASCAATWTAPGSMSAAASTTTRDIFLVTRICRPFATCVHHHGFPTPVPAFTTRRQGKWQRRRQPVRSCRSYDSRPSAPTAP